MADVQELLVNLRFTETGNLAAIKSDMAATETQAGRLTSSVSNAALSLKNLAVAYVGINVAFKVIDFFKESAQAAIDLEAANTRLAASLKANVPAFDGNTEAIDAAAKAGEALGFDNVALLDSFSRIVAATHDVSQALTVQNVALDLARFKQVDLATATDALVHIEAGRYRGLADLGIVLEKGTTQTEALAAVEKVAAGQAETFAKTTAGAFDRASVAIENLKEKIGAPLADAFATLATNVLDATKALGGFNFAVDYANAHGLKPPVPPDAGIRIPVLADAIDLLTGTMQKNDTIVAGMIVHSQQAALAYEKQADSGAHLAAVTVTQTDALYGLGSTLQDTAFGADTADRFLKSLNQTLADGVTPTNAEADAVNRLAAAIALHNEAVANFSIGGVEGTGTLDQSSQINAAKQAAADYAQVLKDNLNLQLSNAKDLATSLFDKLHERHLQAINDVEALAQKNRDATTAQIADVLRLQLARDAAPVNAAEKAQSDIEISRQHRDLGAALASAQASGDPLAIRQAQEALQSFQAQQHIAYLKEQQAIHDLAAQADAAAKQKVADDTLNAAKLAQAAALKAETDRQQKQLKDFDNALAALKKRDEGASPSKVRSDVTALEKRFGIVTDASGFHHIEDPLVTAIKNVKIPAPNLYQTIYITIPATTLNGRAVSAAQALTLSPSSASSVRVGNLKPIG